MSRPVCSALDLPANWSLVETCDGQMAYQRADIDHYITRTDVTGTGLVVLLAQYGRAYTVPLAWRTLAAHGSAEVGAAVSELARESNCLLSPEDADK